MARPKKFDYDSEEFYKEILTLATQGLTDAEIAYSLSDRFGQSLTPSVFCTMKNGNYAQWNKKENKVRSEKLNKVLARGRAKINAAVRGAYLKAAFGGKIVKGKTKRYLATKCDCGGSDPNCPTCHGLGMVYSDYYAVVDETEQELAPNVQAITTWLLHHDPEWRKIERKQDNDEGVPTPDEVSHGVNIEDWIKTEIKNKKND